MSDKARELVANLQAAWNEKDWEKLRDLHTPNWIEHNVPEEVGGLDGLHGMFLTFTAAFPDLRMEPINVISNGDYVSSHYEVTGTHTGEFMGISPSGKEVKFRGITHLIMQDDVCTEAWTVLDQLSMMQQIGAIPVPG